MPALTSTAGAVVRTCAKQRLPALRAPAVALQQRSNSTYPTWKETTKIPDFSHYKSSRSESENRTFSYVMAGSFGALTAMGAKATVQGTSTVCDI